MKQKLRSSEASRKCKQAVLSDKVPKEPKLAPLTAESTWSSLHSAPARRRLTLASSYSAYLKAGEASPKGRHLQTHLPTPHLTQND